MKTRYIILFAFLMFACITSSQAQETTQDTTQTVSPQPDPEPKPKQKTTKDKVYFGGNIGLTLGNYTMIAIRPMVGYKLTPKLSAGATLSYEYITDKRYETTYETSNYGGSIFARYRLLPQLYGHIEYAAMNYELFNPFGESEREWVPFLLAGGGYSQNLGGRTWLNVQVLFDVLQDEKSPYKNWEPFYSVGVGVGF